MTRTVVALIAGIVTLVTCIANADGQSQGASPIPPPPYRETADCERPSYATDRLVCDDPALRMLDTALARRLEMARTDGSLAVARFIEDQGAWLRRRSLCAFEVDHRGCAEAAYRTRLIELEMLAGDRKLFTSAMCSSGLGAVKVVLGGGASLTLHAADGRPILVSFPRGDTSWKPFMTYSGTGTSIAVRNVDGTATIRCRRRSKWR